MPPILTESMEAYQDLTVENDGEDEQRYDPHSRLFELTIVPVRFNNVPRGIPKRIPESCDRLRNFAYSIASSGLVYQSPPNGSASEMRSKPRSSFHGLRNWASLSSWSRRASVSALRDRKS